MSAMTRVLWVGVYLALLVACAQRITLEPTCAFDSDCSGSLRCVGRQCEAPKDGAAADAPRSGAPCPTVGGLRKCAAPDQAQVCEEGGRWSACFPCSAGSHCFIATGTRCQCGPTRRRGMTFLSLDGAWQPCQCLPLCEAPTVQRACACKDGQTGEQSCQTGGKWGPCQCQKQLPNQGCTQVGLLRACACNDGTDGVQVCNRESRWQECSCP